MVRRRGTIWRDAGRRAVAILMALPMLVGFLPRVVCAVPERLTGPVIRPVADAAPACCAKQAAAAPAKACEDVDGESSKNAPASTPRPCDQHCPGCPPAGLMPPAAPTDLARATRPSAADVPADDTPDRAASLPGIFHPPRP